MPLGTRSNAHMSSTDWSRCPNVRGFCFPENINDRLGIATVIVLRNAPERKDTIPPNVNVWVAPVHRGGTSAWNPPAHKETPGRFLVRGFPCSGLNTWLASLPYGSK